MTADPRACRDLADRVEAGKVSINEALTLANGLLGHPISGLLMNKYAYARAHLSAVKALEGERPRPRNICLGEVEDGLHVCVERETEHYDSLAECTGPDAEERARLAALLRLRAHEMEG